MEYSPPPLFKQGASARVKVVFFSLIALSLLVADSRLRSLAAIRQAVGAVLYPLQVMALLPRDAAYMAGDYFTSLSAMQKENKTLKQQQVANAQTLQQVHQLAAENDHLRKLLAAKDRVPVNSLMSEILYDARDPFTRKIVVDRGSRNGVEPGQPVIDDVGVVGQVTRVFPFTAEITLLTDKDQAIPVQVVRSGLRSIAYGQGHSGSLDLRFMPTNADIKSGDMLVTSGIDGVYPAGLSVAKVVNVENKSTDMFARIACQPLAGIDRNRQLLILLADTHLPPRPAPEEMKKDRLGKKRGVEAANPAQAQPIAPQPTAQAAPAQPAAAPQPVPQPASVQPASAAPVQPAPMQPTAVKEATPPSPKATTSQMPQPQQQPLRVTAPQPPAPKATTQPKATTP